MLKQVKPGEVVVDPVSDAAERSSAVRQNRDVSFPVFGEGKREVVCIVLSFYAVSAPLWLGRYKYYRHIEIIGV